MIHSAYYGLPVLITGGCGFIGSHIAEQLVALGARVTILDDLSNGFFHNIEHIAQQINFMNTSITDISACMRATLGQQIVFHLAAKTSVPESVINPHDFHQVNVNGTFNILEASRLNNVKRVILSSSAAVYGDTEHICNEQDNCNPSSPYGFNKQLCEILCQQYSKTWGLETVILRYFNVFGPRQNPHGTYASVVAKFCEQMRHNHPITIFGDGTQTRDFIHVSAVVQANLTMGIAHVQQGEIFNIATGKSITLLELIQFLKQHYHEYNAPLYFESARAGDLKHSYADCSKYQLLAHQLYGKTTSPLPNTTGAFIVDTNMDRDRY